MTDAPRVLLVDDDQLLLNGLIRLLRTTRHRVLAASTAEAAGALLTSDNVGVIVCEPRDTNLAAFLIEARQHHAGTVRIILTGYAGMNSVVQAVNEAHPFKLLMKPWLDDELRATIKLAFEQYAVNRKRDRLIEEYAGIRISAERVHAFHVLGALLHSAHPAMTADAINDMPIGALLLKDDALVLLNPTAQRFLAARGLPAPATGCAIADLPVVLTALLTTAIAAPRGQRLNLRGYEDLRIDYFVQEVNAGTLVAFAPTRHESVHQSRGGTDFDSCHRSASDE